MSSPQDFEKTFSEKGDVELYDALSNPGDFLPEALDAVKKEFARRSLPPDRGVYLGRRKVAEEGRAYRSGVEKVQKTVGGFDLFGLLSLSAGGMFAFYTLFSGGHLTDEDIRNLFLANVLIGWGLVLVLVAAAMQKAKRWSRLAGVAVAFLALLGFPLGTLFGVIWLSRLFSSDVSWWFSGQLPQGVEADTSKSKAKRKGTSPLIWVVVAGWGLILVLTAISMFSRR